MFTSMIGMEDGLISMGIIMTRMGNLMILHLASRILMRIGYQEAAHVRISFNEITGNQGRYRMSLVPKARTVLLKPSHIIS